MTIFGICNSSPVEQVVDNKDFLCMCNFVLSKSYLLPYKISKVDGKGGGTNLASKHLVSARGF